MRVLSMIALVIGVIGCGGPTPTGTTDEELRRSVNNPCLTDCQVQWKECDSLCLDADDPDYCMCTCQNSHYTCVAKCNGGPPPPLRYCPANPRPGDGR